MTSPKYDDSPFSVFSYALLQAAAQGDVEAVQDCLANGASVEATDGSGRTALMLACASRYRHTVKVVEILLKAGANHAHHDDHNNTPAHVAARVGNVPVLLALRSAGAPLDDCNLDLNTPLHLADNKLCTTVLLMAGGRSYVENRAGYTPLMSAVLREDVGSVAMHMQYRANHLHRSSKTGFNAVALAWDEDLPEILRVLHQCGPQSERAMSFEDWLTAALRGTPIDRPGHPEDEAPLMSYRPGTQRANVLPVHPVGGATSIGPAPDPEGQGVYPYFDMDALKRALALPTDDERPKYLKQMQERGNLRVLRTVPATFDFSRLREDFPNFDAVSDFLEKQVELCRLAPNQVASFQPLMLLGDPGVGKTRYLLEVSKLLGLEFGLIQCGGVSASFVLSGSSTSWKNGKPGKIHTTLRDGQTLNPIVMLDEIDKLGGSHDYDAHGPLYQLLEQKTAQAFQDECIEVPMNCSHMIWVATANHLHMIPDAIVSRLVVIDVPAPTGEGLQRVTRSIYRDILQEHADTWGGRFDPELSSEMLDAVKECRPREIRKLLLNACGTAALRRSREGAGAGAVCLTPADFGALPASQHTRRVGFQR